ncbi:MAG: 2-oxoacid:ferredoxin oxidoreductase subunit beta, partial [Methanothrix sp.]
TVQGNDAASFEEAQKIIRTWNYDSSEAAIPLGKFYQIEASRFDQAFAQYLPNLQERESKINVLLENFI